MRENAVPLQPSCLLGGQLCAATQKAVTYKCNTARFVLFGQSARKHREEVVNSPQ